MQLSKHVPQLRCGVPGRDLGRSEAWLVAAMLRKTKVTKASSSIAAIGSNPLAIGLIDRAAERHRNEHLQHLRGLGAVLVLLYHAAYYIGYLRGDQSLAAVFPGYLGTYGVALFFVLSGYLMAAASLDAPASRFLLDRIVRIYPLLMIVVALTIIGLWITGFPRRPDAVALLLAPAGVRDYMLGVEWTLLFEMTYYVLIASAMALRLRRLLTWAVAVWLVILATVSVFDWAPEQTLTPTLTALFGQSANSAFLIGFLLHTLSAAAKQARSLAVALAMGALCVAAATPSVPESAYRWLGALSAALLVMAALSAPPSGPSFGNRALSKLGDASYALYLVHVPFMLISHQILKTSLPAAMVFFLWICGPLALALALTPLDRTLHQVLKARVRAMPPRLAASAAFGFALLFVGTSLYQQYRIEIAADALERARRTHAAVPATSRPSLLAAIDSAAILTDGRLIARGYAIDLIAPDGDSHIVIEQMGRVVAMDRMTRMRPAIARSSNRSDLTGTRFGFAAVTETPLECHKGPLTAKVILSSNTVVAIDIGAAGLICPDAGARPEATSLDGRPRAFQER